MAGKGMGTLTHRSGALRQTGGNVNYINVNNRGHCPLFRDERAKRRNRPKVRIVHKPGIICDDRAIRIEKPAPIKASTE